MLRTILYHMQHAEIIQCKWNLYHTIEIENPYNINRNYRIQLQVTEYKWNINVKL